jgi:hypothetical protein
LLRIIVSFGGEAGLGDQRLGPRRIRRRDRIFLRKKGDSGKPGWLPGT